MQGPGLQMVVAQQSKVRSAEQAYTVRSTTVPIVPQLLVLRLYGRGENQVTGVTSGFPFAKHQCCASPQSSLAA